MLETAVPIVPLIPGRLIQRKAQKRAKQERQASASTTSASEVLKIYTNIRGLQDKSLA